VYVQPVGILIFFSFQFSSVYEPEFSSQNLVPQSLVLENLVLQNLVVTWTQLGSGNFTQAMVASYTGTCKQEKMEQKAFLISLIPLSITYCIQLQP
jgi:hypothetical protein